MGLNYRKKKVKSK